MIPKLDMESEAFKAELAKTQAFTQKVVASQGWAFHTNEEVVEGIELGLTRNKMVFGKRFCPCFMVEPDPEKEGKYKSTDDRICPCKPAIEDEIPNKGVCHCQIFCTPEYVATLNEEA